MTIDSADDSKISNRTINTNRISNQTYDSKSNRITRLRRSLQAWRLSLFSSLCQTKQMPIRSYQLLHSRTGEDHWDSNAQCYSIIQQDLKSNNLSLNEAINMAENCTLWTLMLSTFAATHFLAFSSRVGRDGHPECSLRYTTSY